MDWLPYCCSSRKDDRQYPSLEDLEEQMLRVNSTRKSLGPAPKGGMVEPGAMRKRLTGQYSEHIDGHVTTAPVPAASTGSAGPTGEALKFAAKPLGSKDMHEQKPGKGAPHRRQSLEQREQGQDESDAYYEYE